MGKKKTSKGKGAEKTATKTEKNAQKRAKKLIQEQGEEDIEEMIAQFQAEDKKRSQTIEEKCPPPSRRCNMSLTAHPDNDELIMFGGEYFNGNKTLLYNDLFFYNVKTNVWSKVTAPNPPPPRCAHQAVALRQDGGQLWVFGGEFASPSQSQFYHYKDLWMFSLRHKKWQKVSAPGGPSSRSGHRMVAYKKLLILFGGFHDNIRDYKYYNDVYMFSLDTYTWTKLDVSGSPPAPRSACVMAVTGQGKVLVYGGYSKERVKKDTDLGKTHSDMFLLTPEGKSDKDDVGLSKWKWVSVRQQGMRPSPRCGCALAATSNHRALVFGGVYDEEEDEESISGKFFNDLYDLEMDKGTWHEVQLLGKRDQRDRKRRRRKKKSLATDDKDAQIADESDEEEEEEEETESDDNDDEVDEKVQKLTLAQPVAVNTNVEEESVFKVTIGPPPTQTAASLTPEGATGGVACVVNAPCRRMNALMVMKHGVLYLYGGIVENGDRQLTLADLYALDLRKLDEWHTIITDETALEEQEWQDTSSSSDSEDEDDDDDDELMPAAAAGKDIR